jgi:hypothetical protein
LALVVFVPSLQGERLLPTGGLHSDPVVAGLTPPSPRLPHVFDLSAAMVDYPADVVAARDLGSLRLPLWNPYIEVGAPLLAEWHTAPLSPLKLPFDLHPSPFTYELYLAMRIPLAMLGAFLLARRRGLARTAAALSGVLYGLSGAVVMRFALPTEGTAQALLPLVLVALSAAAEGEGPAGLWVGALSVGVLAIASHPELFALALGGAALGAFVGVASPPSPPGVERPAPTRRATRIVLASVIGVALAAVQIFPFVVFAASARSYKLAGHSIDLPGFVRAQFSYMKVALALLLFLGGAGTALALHGLRRREARGVRVYSLVVAGLVVVLIGASLVLPAPYAWLMPWHYSLFLLALGGAVAAGHGACHLVGAEGGSRVVRQWGAAVGVVALVLGVAIVRARDSMIERPTLAVAALVSMAIATFVIVRIRERPGVAVALMAAVSFGELVVFARPRLYDEPQLHLEDLAASPAVEALRNAAPPPARVAGVGTTAGFLEQPLTPNLAASCGMQDVRGIAVLFPPRYERFMRAVGATDQPTARLLSNADSPLLALAGVDAVATPATANPPAGMALLERTETYALYRRLSPVPAAFFVPQALPAADADQAFSLLADHATDAALGRIGIVEAPASELPAAVSDEASAPTSTASLALWSSADAEHASVEAVTNRPSVLILTTLYDPGWTATVDGQRATVYPADGFAQALVLQAGNHQVELTYRPASVSLGLAVSGVTGLLVVGLAAAAWLRRRRLATQA